MKLCASKTGCIPLCNHCMKGKHNRKKGMTECSHDGEAHDPCDVCDEFECFMIDIVGEGHEQNLHKMFLEEKT